MRLARFVLVLQFTVNLILPVFDMNFPAGSNPSIPKSMSLSQNDLKWVSAPQWILDIEPWLTLPTDEPILLQAIKQDVKTHENAEQYADAIELIKAGLILFPSDSFFPFRMGMIFAIFQPEQAQQYLLLAANENWGVKTKSELVSESLDSQPHSSALDWVHAGQIMAQVNEWMLAKVAFTKAVTMDDELADAWALLGQARNMIGEDGYNQFGKALQVNPNSSIGLALMSLYWKERQRYDLAINYMKLLTIQKPEEASWQIELGSLYSLSQDMPSALKAYTKATEISSGQAKSWQSLAQFSSNYGVQVENVGLPAIRKALELAPKDPLSLTIMGQIMIQLGDRDTAERFLKQATGQAPSMSVTHYFMGYLYNLENNRPLAYNELVEVIRLDGENGYGPLARRILEQDYSSK